MTGSPRNWPATLHGRKARRRDFAEAGQLGQLRRTRTATRPASSPLFFLSSSALAGSHCAIDIRPGPGLHSQPGRPVTGILCGSIVAFFTIEGQLSPPFGVTAEPVATYRAVHKYALNDALIRQDRPRYGLRGGRRRN